MNHTINCEKDNSSLQKRHIIYKEIDNELLLLNQAIQEKNQEDKKIIENRLSVLVEHFNKLK